MMTLVLLSGGKHSAAVLHAALIDNAGKDVVALTINPGPAYAKQVAAAGEIAHRAGVVHHIAAVDFVLDGRALPQAPVGAHEQGASVFGMIAAGRLAATIGANRVYVGASRARAATHPDHSHEATRLLQEILIFVVGRPVQLVVPLLDVDDGEFGVFCANTKGADAAIALAAPD